ncbi:MAG: ribonuclease R [Erysipelotrichaceae bacterium]
MNLKQNILDLMSSSRYKGKSVDDWKSFLHMETSEQLVDLMKALNALEDECLVVRDALDHYQLAEKMGYFIGLLRVNPKGFGFVEDETRSYYVNRSNFNFGLDGDRVFVKTWSNLNETTECEVIKILEHNTKNIIGVVKVKDGKTKFLPDTNIERRIDVTNYKDFKLVNDLKVLLKVDRFDKVLKCSIVEIIGHKYDPGVDVLSVLMEHDIFPEFPKEVMAQAQAVSDVVTEADLIGRRDLRDQVLITIDGDDAKDLDDAVSVERIDGGFRLGVHIADVSHYVTKNSPLDLEAYERGTSVYVVDRVVPMLPHVLSNGICSLNPHVDRLTITCSMDIDSKGEVMAYQIYPSVIHTSERMTYANVNEIIRRNEAMREQYAHITPLIDDAYKLSKIIRKRREKLGSIDFDTREGKVIVDKKGRAIDVVVRERYEAEKLIEDFMICANEVVATHVKWCELPSMYRIHEQPDAKKMREFVKTAQILGHKFKGSATNVKPSQLQKMLKDAKGDDDYDVLSTFMLRSMQKAKYDLKCMGHFGLGLQEYTHFTSPIRRYPDLVVHRMLHKYVFDHVEDPAVFKEDEAWISGAALQASNRERRAIDAERDVDDMKKAEYMEKHIGRIFSGVVSSITKFGMFVELSNTVEGLVHISNLDDDYYEFDETTKRLVGRATQKTYKMGQKVRVKCSDASRYKKQIDFIVVKR